MNTQGKPLAIDADATSGIPPSSAPAGLVTCGGGGSFAANITPSSRNMSGWVLNRYLSR